MNKSLRWCNGCKTFKELFSFSRNCRMKDGLSIRCKSCRSLYYILNKDIKKENQKRWRKVNPTKDKDWRATHRKSVYKSSRKWEQKNPGLVALRNVKRHVKRLLRIPSWASAEEKQLIRMFYQNCPTTVVVDHIIPLCGKSVSGLHVLSNLQYLSPKENRVKGNKYE